MSRQRYSAAVAIETRHWGRCSSPISQKISASSKYSWQKIPHTILWPLWTIICPRPGSYSINGNFMVQFHAVYAPLCFWKTRDRIHVNGLLHLFYSQSSAETLISVYCTHILTKHFKVNRNGIFRYVQNLVHEFKCHTCAQHSQAWNHLQICSQTKHSTSASDSIPYARSFVEKYPPGVCDIVPKELQTVYRKILQNTATEDLSKFWVKDFLDVLCFSTQLFFTTLPHSVHSVFGFCYQIWGGGYRYVLLLWGHL